MRSVSRLLLASALAVGLTSGGLLATTSSAQQAMTFTIGEENSSGVSGTAALTPMSGGTQVVVELQNAPGPHPIHIHLNQCGPTLDPTPLVNLTPVQNGRSETMVQVTIDQIMARAHAINVHKSPQEASVYVACGNISMGPTTESPSPPTGVPVAAQPKPGAPAPKPGDPAPKPGMPAMKPAPAASPAPATKPDPAAKPGPAPAQAPRALPRTGEADPMSWAIGGLAAAGVVLLGAGLVARRRGV